MKSVYFLLFTILLTGCAKENVMPITAKQETDEIKKVSSVSTTNSDYWYNGTLGTAEVRVSCKGCTAIASFGTDAIPFLFNEDGVGYLKYTPKAELPVYIAVCPGNSKAISVDILDSKNAKLFSYSGTISSNWINTFIIK